MMRTILFLSVILFMFTPVFAMAGAVGSDEPIAEVVTGENKAVTSEVIVLEDGTEEVQISVPEAEGVHAFVDDRVVAIENEARERIQAVMEEIRQFDGRSDEGELQKEIERIKLDAEIARFKMYLEDAEEAQNYGLADEMRAEIEHLENLDQQVIGVPEEQPAHKQRATNGKEEK